MILITGSGGLVGYTASNFFLKKKLKVIGIDNNKRKYLFGKNSSVIKKIKNLKKNKYYTHYDIDINNIQKINQILKRNEIKLFIHTAAQPSHDWSATNPLLDFDINSYSTLKILEAIRNSKQKTTFIFLSTNKVYGDSINFLKYKELKTRFEIDNKKFKEYKNGFNENINIDNSMHSPFGISKLSADLMVQEYGKYFNMNTVCLRAGCLTGEHHSSAELHGFLSYLFKCAFYNKKYYIYGYKGKQVRDNLSAHDVSKIFWEIFKKPPPKGEVFNIGGGIHSNVSILEAIEICQEITGNKINFSYINKARKGDHIYWVTDMKKFKKFYPKWNIEYNTKKIIKKMYEYEKII